jgi:hypothetical protein
MSISTNPLTAGWSGSLGKQVVFRQRGGKTIICKYPRFRKRKRTEKQRVVNKRMEEAHLYASKILGNEEQRNEAQVRLNVTRNKLYTSLVSEYFKTFRTPQEDSAGTPPLPSVSEANTNFVEYLLKNTSQTPEEIALLARVPVEFVISVKNSR